MSWASERKAAYTLSFILAAALIAGAIGYLSLHKPASCFDGIQNEGEQGIDCGGPCARLCQAAYAAPTVLWTQWTKERSGTYSILAYAENPNIGVGAAHAPYAFRIYDANDLLLYNASTSYTAIPADNNFAVFASGINLFDKVPARIDFSFGTDIGWARASSTEAGISVVSKTLSGEATAPKLLATLENTTLAPIANIQSIAILYDADGNAIAFSKTLTDAIAPGATADIAFTWPAPFSAAVYKIDILSQVLP
ncbi:MAG: FxLYD domain-containing protein [Patescibacteria group bacterium]|nr:FxLYD domain-containing protein [Patescibacteria group bacterium]